MRRLESVNKNLEKIDKQRAALLETKLAIIKELPLSCPQCKKDSTLRSWRFVELRWRIKPADSSCTWNHYEFSHCQIECPECNTRCIVHDHPKKADLLECREQFRHSQLFDNCTEEFVPENL